MILSLRSLRGTLPFGSFFIEGELVQHLWFLLWFQKLLKGKAGKARAGVKLLSISHPWHILFSSSFCALVTFFSGGLWRYWIVPGSRIRLWCRDMPGSNNNEQNRPILLKSKIQVQMWITTDLIPLSHIWQQVANNYPCFSFWRIFHMAAFQNSISNFLTKQKLRNLLKLHFYFIK